MTKYIQETAILNHIDLSGLNLMDIAKDTSAKVE
jgi:hypothetical protein